jgi:hypothetical protein
MSEWRRVADAVRRKLPFFVALLVLSGVGNLTDQPRWTNIQLAADAASFRGLSPDPIRVAVSAGFDVIIAASYGALGIAATSTARQRGRIASTAAAGIIVGAAADELENLLALLNLVRRATVSDTWIYAMRVAGAFKLLAFVGVFAWIAVLIRHRVQARDVRSR